MMRIRFGGIKVVWDDICWFLRGTMVSELCRIESRQAGYILQKMVKKHPEFVMVGKKEVHIMSGNPEYL
jgi:hypothetical protein